MTESENDTPPSEATFESLENELQVVIQKLEDPAVPLEERLQLHARAGSMHKTLESILEAARNATGEAAKRKIPQQGNQPTAAGGEPYEAARDRLAQVVDTLESDGLPLARVVELHDEAQQLAARCEAILDGAQERISQAAVSSAGDRLSDQNEGPGDAPS